MDQAAALATAGRRKDALERLVRDFGLLAEVDQREAYLRFGEFLELEGSDVDDERANRWETVEMLRQAMAHLGVDRPIKVQEYRKVAQELNLPWSWNQILRLWDSFATAAAVAAGQQMPRTIQQRAFLSAYGGGRAPAREEPFAAVRRWLETKPAKETNSTYDGWARAANYALPGSGAGLPLPRAATMRQNTGLRWRQILAVAKGELDHPAAFIERHQRLSEARRGPHDLIGLADVAALLGKTYRGAELVANDGLFPRPALLVANGRRAWLREEVEAFRDGVRGFSGEADRLRPFYLFTAEVAERLVLKPVSITPLAADLEPAGMIGRYRYWLKSDVEAYERRHAGVIAGRKATRARPGVGRRLDRQSEFVSKMDLVKETGMTLAQVKALAARPDFPAPVARFAGAGLWRREAVRAYLEAELEEQGEGGALQEELVSAAELLEEGWTESQLRSKHLPAAVAVLPIGRIWRRSEIESARLRSPELGPQQRTAARTRSPLMAAVK